MRESPLVKLADTLINQGYELSIYDPAVSRAKTMGGANQLYITEGIPHISACLVEDTEAFKDGAELFVIGNSNESYGDILNGGERQRPHH